MSGFHTIHLHGALGKKFGKSYRLMVATPGEAIHALACQIPEFATGIRDGQFRCIVGPTTKKGRKLSEAIEVQNPFLPGELDFHIVPAITGRGGKGGSGKIIIGILLIAVAIAVAIPTGGTSLIAASSLAGSMGLATATTLGITYSTTLMALGVMTALGGLAMMLSPQPKGTTANAANTQNSFMFNGTDNTAQQGGPVPLFYGGPLLIGSVVIEEGLQSFDYVVGNVGDPTDVNNLAPFTG
jgi:predicted phage tail protein